MLTTLPSTALPSVSSRGCLPWMARDSQSYHPGLLGLSKVSKSSTPRGEGEEIKAPKTEQGSMWGRSRGCREFSQLRGLGVPEDQL